MLKRSCERATLAAAAPPTPGGDGSSAPPVEEGFTASLGENESPAEVVVDGEEHNVNGGRSANQPDAEGNKLIKRPGTAPAKVYRGRKNEEEYPALNGERSKKHGDEGRGVSGAGLVGALRSIEVCEGYDRYAFVRWVT